MRFLTFILFLFLLACEQQLPEVDPTVIDEEAFDVDVLWTSAEVDGHTVSFPSDWTLVETPVEFLFWYDEGLTGSVVIDRHSQEIQIRDKGMPMERRAEAERIVEGFGE